MGYDPIGRISDPLEPIRQELFRLHEVAKEASTPEGTRISQLVRNIGAQVKEIEEVSRLNTESLQELEAQETIDIQLPDRSFNIVGINSVDWTSGFSFTPTAGGFRNALLSGRIYLPHPGADWVDYDQQLLFLSEGGRLLMTPDWIALNSAASSAPSGSISFSIPLRLQGGEEHQFQLRGRVASFGPGSQTIWLRDILYSLKIFDEVT